MPARRCCLSVPGSSERMLVVEAIGSADWGATAVAVRVNAPRTPWCHADFVALAGARPALGSVVLPKVEDAGDVAFAERLLDGARGAAGAAHAPAVQALIETAAGLARVQDIAGASPRLEALVLGYADLGASLGRTAAGARDLDGWRPAQEALLLAARAHGLQAIDGPWLGTSVDEAFLAAAGRAADAGFDGKWAIHPAQLAALAERFTPAAEEVERARAVIAALDAAAREDRRGAVALDGEMLDEAVRVAALRTLARAEAAAAR